MATISTIENYTVGAALNLVSRVLPSSLVFRLLRVVMRAILWKVNISLSILLGFLMHKVIIVYVVVVQSAI